MKNFISIFFLLILNLKLYPGFPGLNSFAQKYNFQNYSLAEGLSQSQALAMCKDSKGNIWIGTHGGGADKFDGKSFTNYTRADGLSNNMVFSLMEDSKGNMWFGTWGGGVNKYDGQSFTHITDKEGLAGNMVRAIFEDTKGNMWFGTAANGLSMLIRGDIIPDSAGSLNIVNYTTKDGLGANNVWNITQDNKGNIWFAHYGGGVSKLIASGKPDKYSGKYPDKNDSSESATFINYQEKDGLTDNRATNILEDSKGNIWVSTRNGTNKIIPSDSDNTAPKIIKYTKKTGFISDVAGPIVKDNKDNIWIGTDDGLAVYIPEEDKFLVLTEKSGLCNNRVWSMVKDNEGNIWIGTDGGGISKYPGNVFAYYTEEFGLADNTVWSVAEDKSGNMWLGTDGGGVNKLVFHAQKSYAPEFQKYTEKDELSKNVVFSVLVDSRNNIWLGTSDGVSRLNPNEAGMGAKAFTNFKEEKQLNGKYVYSLFEDSKGNIWIGAHGAGAVKYNGKNFNYYTRKEGAISDHVMAICEDRSGNLWFGTMGGLSKYTPLSSPLDKGGQRGVFTNFSDKNGLTNNYVTTVTPDDEGNIWLGTYGGGVLMLPENESSDTGSSIHWKYFSTKDGLIDDAIGPLVFDAQGNLWIGTIKGLDKLDIAEYKKTGKKKFKHFGKLEGFPGLECTSMYEDSKGNIWIGTPDMLTKYNPEADIPNTVEPITQITNIRLFYKNVDWKKYADSITNWYSLPINLTLPYNQNHFSFDFTGVCLSIPEKVRYQFMLEGLDENWSPVTQKNEAVYSNIPPGEYTFKVIACNNDGLWNKEPAVFSFVITPPFWQTWWFRITCFLLLVAGIWSYINYRERSLKEQKRVLEEKVDERTKELKEEKEKVEIQKEEIELRNVLITDSIDYAKRIQDAALPPPEHVKTHFPDSFVLLKPKDVVSGDFFWMHRQNGNIMLAAADCTGHGVPGAFMSIICNNILNNIVTTQNSLTPGTILKLMSEQLIIRLKQREGEGVLKDGLDIALCCLKYTSDDSVVERSRNHRVIATLQYAGAHNPLYIISNGELSEIKADKLFIGITEDASDITFTEHSVKLKKGDCIYIFSDGFVDQKGGQKGKKFYYPPFQQLLVDIHQKSMEEQKEHLNKTIEEWKGSRVQVDDILVIGVRV